MDRYLKKLAGKLFLKWADEIPPTLRSGLMPEEIDPGLAKTERPAPVTVDVDGEVGAPSLLDTNQHLRSFNKDKKNLYIILNLMYKSGIVTPWYYQGTIKHLDESEDTTNIFFDFVDIIHKAELEAEKYMKNLHILKNLIRK